MPPGRPDVEAGDMPNAALRVDGAVPPPCATVECSVDISGRQRIAAPLIECHIRFIPNDDDEDFRDDLPYPLSLKDDDLNTHNEIAKMRLAAEAPTGGGSSNV
jgi:hypothetical protein